LSRKVVVRARLGRGAQWLVGPKITCLGSVRSRHPGMAPIGRGTPLQRRHDRRTPRCGFPLQSPQFSPTKPDGLEGAPAGCGAGPACEAKRPSARAAPPACAAKKLIPAPATRRILVPPPPTRDCATGGDWRVRGRALHPRCIARNGPRAAVPCSYGDVWELNYREKWGGGTSFLRW
jgi:hypothetical protein